MTGQSYSNSWINFNQNYFKIELAEDGIYRIPYSVLSAAIPNLNTINGSQFTMYRNGSAQKIYVTTSSPLSSGDFIEFYGQKNDGETDRLLFTDPSWMPNTHYSFFSDTSAYFLTWNNLSLNPRIEDFVNDLTNLPPKETFIWTKVVQTFKKQFLQGVPYSTFSSNLYNAEFEDGEGFYDNDFLSTKNYTVNTPNISYNGAPVSYINTVVASWSTGDHHLRLNLNGVFLYDTSFTGYHVNNIKQTTATINLQAVNTLQYSALAPGTDRNAVSCIEVIYPRNMNFSGMSSFSFRIDGDPSNRKYLEVNNFNDKGQEVILYDLTNGLRITSTQSPGSNPVKFALPVSFDSRQCYIRADHSSEIKTVNDLKAVNFVNYSNAGKQGDFIIVSHPKLYNDGTGFNWVEEYRKYRDKNENPEAEFDAIIADIDQLYDQFAYGIKKHPLAIRNFVIYVYDQFIIQPKSLFLVGKGSLYHEMRLIPAYYDQCLIPTFGNPASDKLLAADFSNGAPLIPVGRLSASTGNDVRIYLNKVQQYESEQMDAGDFFQTVENKLWMKNVLHFGGGTSSSEQNLLKSYLISYQNKVEKTYTGAKVDTFYKKTSDPIETSQSEHLKKLITEGVSLITFFGHSSPGSFDVSIDEPENYTNAGKYPLIYSNGCFAGYLYGTSPSFSERFVLAENKGAIAFLSTTGLSISISLDVFATHFYRNLSKDLYAQPLGDLIKATIVDVNNNNPGIYTEMVTHEMTLHGDPSIKLNHYEEVDYAIEPSGVRFEPPVVSTVLDSFEMFIDVYNLGKAISDSMSIRLNRTISDGSQELYYKRIKAPFYKETVRFVLPVKVSVQNGEEFNNTIEKFSIFIDPLDEIPNESSEINNQLPNSYFPGDIRLNIVADDIFPVVPYDFGIVGSINTILRANTSNPFSSSRWYVLESDTSALFNSPFKKSNRTFHPGGIIEWPVSLLDKDSVVYYWRVARDSSDADAINWHQASFVYLKDNNTGWNQSHHFQYQGNSYANIYLDSTDRKFKFVDDLKEIDVTTGVGSGIGGSLPDDELAWELNGVKMHRWRMGGCGGLHGLTFAVINENSGLPWSSINQGPSNFGPYGNYHCSFQYFEQFGFNFSTTGTHPDLGIPWSQVIINFIDSVPDGHYILMYSHNKPPYTSWDNSLVNKLVNMGALSVLPLSQGGFNAAPYIFFTQKGNSSYPHIEKLGTDYSNPVSEKIFFSGVWNEGFFRSDLIGPALDWDRLSWKSNSVEAVNTDNTNIIVYGIPYANSNSQVKLASLEYSKDTLLDFIDANQYPYLRLEFHCKDDINRTPSQLEFWRVYFTEAPDAAINPKLEYRFSDDTLYLGATLEFKVAAENISKVPMDPLLVKFGMLDAKQTYDTSYNRFDMLAAGDSIHINKTIVTHQELVGDNVFTVELNPDKDQIEKHHFNNIGILNFKVIGDEINPLLDVTFDGQHILDGDIVSAKPFILVSLTDENDFLILDDTSAIRVEFKYPDGSIHKVFHKDEVMNFIPAASGPGVNTAKVELKPHFTDDGIYQLIVWDQDKSGNPSGKNIFKISFEIITSAGITNVLNYPNPFTTSTQFVFTLTGSEVPDYFKIQIMTIKGKVVKEITQEEIGDLHIGRNITDYAWNGTDHYGDPLGNGVYFYRVVTRLSGETIEHIRTGADKYFAKGMGKMVLLR